MKIWCLPSDEVQNNFQLYPMQGPIPQNPFFTNTKKFIFKHALIEQHASVPPKPENMGMQMIRDYGVNVQQQSN